MLGSSLGCSDYESGIDSERRKLDKNRVTILDFRRTDFILCMDLLEEFHRILSVFKYGIFHTWGWSILTGNQAGMTGGLLEEQGAPDKTPT